MNKRSTIPIILTLIVIIGMSASVSGSLTIGVKKGDWIEYQVTTAGTFPNEHNVDWTRIEILDVQGITASLNVTSRLTNGTLLSWKDTLNFETGQLLEGFFIPANLTIGDVFFDSLVGNITITGAEQRYYAGADRSVITGITPYTTYYWDDITGVLVKADSVYPEQNYALSTVIDKTNMWHSQILGLEPIIFYTVLTTIIAVAIISITAILLFRRKKTP
jgi:hypothetical protein